MKNIKVPNQTSKDENYNDRDETTLDRMNDQLLQIRLRNIRKGSINYAQ